MAILIAHNIRKYSGIDYERNHLALVILGEGSISEQPPGNVREADRVDVENFGVAFAEGLLGSSVLGGLRAQVVEPVGVRSHV